MQNNYTSLSKAVKRAVYLLHQNNKNKITKTTMKTKEQIEGMIRVIQSRIDALKTLRDNESNSQKKRAYGDEMLEQYKAFSALHWVLGNLETI